MKIISILTILLGFSQCISSKFVKNPSFKVEKATYNKWSGGQPGVSGIKLELQLVNALQIEFDSLYFQNKKTKVETRQINNMLQVTGHFSTSIRKNKDLILDADPTKELKNSPPLLQNFPFKLKDNEAVLSFKKNNKTHYFKIEEIKETPPSFFPSTKQK
ncbi:hypothetical protein [Polaribacter sp.]|uniref:hypothetical protein n=1 Tax=Polaribacter sp. TaxID=1920175 RepID=UPI003F6D2534